MLSVFQGARLAGRETVITGAGAGIGQQTALLFARHGARVVCVDRDSAAAIETVERIKQIVNDQAQDIARAVCADVSLPSDCERMIHTAESTFGRVDVLFNNAGVMIAEDADAIETSEKVWNRTMQINAMGVFLGCMLGSLHFDAVVAAASSILPHLLPWSGLQHHNWRTRPAKALC